MRTHSFFMLVFLASFVVGCNGDSPLTPDNGVQIDIGVEEDQNTPEKDEGVPSDDEGVPSDDEGVPTEDEGVPTEDEGVPTEDEGVPSEDEGVPSEDEGVPSEDEGVPSEDEGVPSEDEGVPIEDEGVPTDDAFVPLNCLEIGYCAEECGTGCAGNYGCLLGCSTDCKALGCDSAKAPYNSLYVCILLKCSGASDCGGGPGPACTTCTQNECAAKNADCEAHSC